MYKYINIHEGVKMFLAQLIYCSMQNGIGDADIQNILDVSQANNTLDNVTGALIYNGRHFLQILEGDRANVTRRFNSILNDTRHKEVELIDFSLIKERRFPHWSMQYIGLSGLDQGIVLTYSSTEFNPFTMYSVEGVVDMIWRLAQ